MSNREKCGLDEAAEITTPFIFFREENHNCHLNAINNATKHIEASVN
jgi:hypothetical protein